MNAVTLDKSVMDRVNLARFKVKVGTLMKECIALALPHVTVRGSEMAKAFAAACGIPMQTEPAELADVLQWAISASVDIDVIGERFAAIKELVEMENWSAIEALAKLNEAKAVAPAGKPAKVHPLQAGGRGTKLPDNPAPRIEVREAPPVNVEEMVSKLMPLLNVNIDARMDGVKASFESLVERGKVDEKALHKLVSASLDKCLTNGHGEAIKEIVQKGGAKMLTELLEKAAAAVSSSIEPSTTPAMASMVVVPTPDPHYHWSPALKQHAELAFKLRDRAPQYAVNLLIIGPTGAGKTTWMREYAARFELPFLKLDCPNMREESSWFGVKNANQFGTYFTKSQFWRAIELDDIVLAFDEFNRVPDHVRNPLMALFDHTRCTFHDEGGLLKVGRRATLAAGMNLGMDYTATTTTDRAMKNRFGLVVNLDYLDQVDEVNVLLKKVAGIDRDVVGKLVEAANTVRAKHKAGTIGDTLSTRQLETAAVALSVGGKSSLELSVFNHFNSDGGGNTDRSQVIEIFQLKGLLK